MEDTKTIKNRQEIRNNEWLAVVRNYSNEFTKSLLNDIRVNLN